MTLEEIAKTKSQEFLTNEKQYRLGFVEAEQQNKITTTLGETFVEDTKKGVKMLLDADKNASNVFYNAICSNEFDKFYEKVLNTLLSGKKIVISGCGSTGRLAMRIEASFREAVSNIPTLKKYEDKVLSLMTGGDYAIIRSVESFEDYIELGATQAKDIGVSNGDLLIGVTATGETTSVLGSAKYALSVGANVYMVVCTKPDTIINKLQRAKEVYSNPNCYSFYLPCGGMAVTGSTRMQSSSLEQATISVALEMSICKMVNGNVDKAKYANIFSNCVKELSSVNSINNIAKQIDSEFNLYSNNGHVTYFATDYILDVLADTTERGPTFSVPHFRPQSKKDLPLSWAFVKNPKLNTISAWENCLNRTPRCIDKTKEDYAKIGIKKEDIEKIPTIDINALYKFEIGNEEDIEREDGNSLATWVDLISSPCKEFNSNAKNYKNNTVFSPLNGIDISCYATNMHIFEHLAMKLSFNVMSTGTMAKMKRIRGNYMVYISISNKKLVDRATRIIADLCKITYEEANYQLFLSREMLAKIGSNRSPAEYTLERLNKK